ncbi:class I SAM-dependent methyltransferase [Streptomyces sp. WMMC500]|uniref:class I SAM-dependent methyltransferase n=1 Tax=Streptomyces sp. WMMC500 TaxID=3015154 RepID=UPI00248B1A1E|nr:class I SAM-dependent methyltransferase [Streptomyces sp. WMMC500]WBB63950.1 class I SAM-dependent methyltransferase [Streptomyces sp. WMMC500]
MTNATEEFGEAYWEEMYRGRDAVWSGRPNPQLVTEIADLTPGTALEAGCGEGADAIWLAERGWRVTAVDISGTALDRARAHAEARGPEVAGRLTWVRADLTDATPDGAPFDLVTTHYVHTTASREALFCRLAATVAPGGTLLVVGHHETDPRAAEMAEAHPGVHFTAADVAADLVPEDWEIAVAEVRTRLAPVGHEPHDGGEPVEHHDAVLRARRR